MNNQEGLRNFFVPLQPTIKDPLSKVQYIEIPPGEQLRPFIYCYWQLKTQEPLSSNFFYSVVADGCIDIFWEMEEPRSNFIMGFSNTYTSFPLNDRFHYVGIRFLPTAFPYLFQMDASIITNKVEWLKDIKPELSKKIISIAENEETLSAVKRELDTHFQEWTDQLNDPLDGRLYSALNLILQAQGNLSLEKDLDVGVSPRQLRRLFKYFIGDTPKAFCKVVRFQHLLKTRPSRESMRKEKSFFDFGYYDQAHFIKEFKHLYGQTPTDAMR